jgi:replicative DNA helicase
MSIPESLDTERSFLCALFRASKLVDTFKDRLKSEIFYFSPHKTILEAIVGLHNSGKATDWVTVSAELQKARMLDSIGGFAYLTGLVECFPTASYAPQHLEILIELAHKRKLIGAANDLVEAVNGTNEELQEACKQTIETIKDWKEKVVTGPDDPTDTKGWHDLLDLLEARYDKTLKGELEGVPTGLHWINQLSQGFLRETFYYICGLPSEGKSALLSQMAIAAARTLRADGKYHKVLIFSLEMSEIKLRERMLSQDRAISSGALKAGLYSEMDFQRFTDTISHLRQQIFIYARRMTVSDIRAAIKRGLAKHPDIDWIGVDYLQRITPEARRKNASREQEVAQVSEDLNALKIEFGIPIVCCAALNSDQEKRKGGRPSLMDFRDSKSAAYDADFVLGLQAEPNGPDLTREVMFHILKNRDGGLDEKKYQFSKRFLLFQEPE